MKRADVIEGRPAAPPARGPRGRLWVHAVAFLLLVASAYGQFRGNLHSSLRLVWTSIGLSGLAIVVAVANLVLPGPRKPGGTTTDPE
jgi:hypothetical protein